MEFLRECAYITVILLSGGAYEFSTYSEMLTLRVIKDFFHSPVCIYIYDDVYIEVGYVFACMSYEHISTCGMFMDKYLAYLV